MNVWNRLGDLARGTKDWIGDIGLAAGAAPKFVWDVATAPWNDRKEFNGFYNTIQQAGIDFTKNVARPIGGVIAAIDKTNQNLIRQPLSAALLYAQSDDKSADGWRRAWEAKDEISFGQAAAGIVGKTSPFRLLPDSITPEFLDDNFNIYDEKQRKKAFSDSIYGRVLSGSFDTAVQLVGDVTLVGGKAVKAAKAADTAFEAIKGIREAKAIMPGFESIASESAKKYSALAEDFAKNDAIWAMNHPWVQQSNNASDVSYLLGVTKNKDEALNTMLALLGDKSGLNALDTLKRPDLAEPLRIASGELTRSQLKVLLREEQRLASGMDDTMLPLGLRTPEEIKADKEFISAWAAHDKYVGKLFELSEEAPVSKGIGKYSQVVGREIATARSIPFHQQPTGYSRVDVYQPTTFHKMYSKISWLQGERPSGMVNLNEGDSIREVTAIVERLVSLSKSGNILTRPFSSNSSFTREEAALVINKYTQAASPEARGKVIAGLEERGYQILANKYDIDSDTAKKLYDYHTTTRTGKLREAREEGFLWDAETETMLKVPLLESQSANFLPVADFDVIDRVLKANGSRIRAISFSGSQLAEMTSDLWKASVLLRLGYPVRNAVDSQLRIFATVGAMASLRHFTDGTRNLVTNISDSHLGTRLIDRFQKVEKLNYKTIKADTQALGREITAHQLEVERLQKLLDANPMDAEATGRMATQANLLRTKLVAYEANSKTLTTLENALSTGKRKTIAQGDLRVASVMRDGNGVEYTVYDAFGSPNGDLYRELNSSDRSFSALLEDYSTLYGANVASKGRGAVTPDMPNYYTDWARSINEEFANSAVARKIMAGENVDDITRWLEENPALRSRLGISRDESLEYVVRVRGFVDNYIPKDSGIREELLGSYSALKSKWPKLQEYKDGGSGGIPGTRSTVGFVKIAALKDMPGNTAGNAEAIAGYRKSLREGKGFAKEFDGKSYNEPIMVVYDNETGLAFIGEGNHRLQAAILEGIDEVPVRVVRGYKQEMTGPFEGGRKPKQIKNDKEPRFVESVGNRMGQPVPEGYIPPEMHPSFIFDKEFIVPENTTQSKVTPEFLRDAVKDPDKLPIIHGNLVDENINMKTRQVTKGIRNELFKYLGSMPENAWARHPLFVDLYQKSIKERIATAEQLKGGVFTREEFDKIQYGLEKAARADALKGVKEILYNVERRSNAAHLLRFVSPFFSAQENAIKTWFKIASDNPVIVNRAALAWTAPNRMGLATDENGNQVPKEKALQPSDTMWFEVPEGLKKLPIIGKGLTSLDKVGISKQSLDVAFQGNPFGVSVGPLTAIPASYAMKYKPELSQVIGFAFPYGPDASVSAVLPTYIRRQWEKMQGQNSSDYARTYQLIYLTEQHKARDEGRPYLTEKQIKDKVDAYYNMRTAANLILPFAPQFNSPYKYYIDKWHEYSQTYGLGADDKFLQDYPEFFDFATSLSKNPTGSNATMTDVENAKRYSGLIAEIAKDNPGLVGAVTRGSGAAKFNPTAYWWQSETSISPGTPEKFRGKATPAESVAANEARKGWALYRRMTAIIDNKLAERGLHSVDQAGAEDLKAAKEMAVRSLSTEKDPVTGKSTGQPSAWYIDYRDVDGLKAAKNVNGLRKIVNNKQFMDDNGTDPTWRSVAVYLQIRDSIGRALASRPSSAITSASNADLKLSLDYYVNQLKQGDVEFADIYERFLSQDKIYDKYLDSGI